jgi:threonine aldolase
MIFASDNWAGAHPRIAAALTAASDGFASAYGSSEQDRRVETMFNEVFEREVAVFFVGTGTAANSLAMAAYAKPGGVVFAHADAHMIADECGAPEFLADIRLRAVDGPSGRMEANALRAAIKRFPPGFVHGGQPGAVSITQSSEIGTIYTLEEIEEIGAIAKSHGLPLHMDGARFANALVSLDVTPAEMTWKRGVDLVSFGATKNGCWCAEALVFMNPADAEGFPFLRKRAAQLFSKSRFMAAQFEAYLTDGLWLENARHANRMAQQLAKVLEASPHTRLAWHPQANEIFPIMEASLAESLRAEGAVFYPWAAPEDIEDQIGEGETLCRFVTSFATTQAQIDAFADLLETTGGSKKAAQ